MTEYYKNGEWYYEVLRKTETGVRVLEIGSKSLAEIAENDKKIERLRNVLRNIADPIAMLKAELPEGAFLNGQIANEYLNSAACLKELAKEALKMKP